MEGHVKRCLTLIFKVIHQDQVTDLGFSVILDNVYVGIDTEIKSAILYTAGAKKSHTMNVCDLEFQGQPSKSCDCFQYV